MSLFSNSAERARNRRIAAQTRLEWLARVACKNGTFDAQCYNDLWRISVIASDASATAEQIGDFWHKYWEFTRLSGARTFTMRIASLYDGIKVCLGFGPESESAGDASKVLSVSAAQVPFAIQYAAQAGKKIDQQTCESILKSCAKVRSSSVTEVEVAEFWMLYKKFNEQLDPASISSCTRTLQVRESVFVGPFIVMGLLALAVFAGTVFVLVQYSNVVANRTYLDRALTGLSTSNADFGPFVLAANSVGIQDLQPTDSRSDSSMPEGSAGSAGSTPPVVPSAKGASNATLSKLSQRDFFSATVVARPATRSPVFNQAVADPDWPAHVEPLTFRDACVARLAAVKRVEEAAEALNSWLAGKQVFFHGIKDNKSLFLASNETCGSPDSEILPTAYGLRFQASLKVDRYAQLLLPTLLGLLGATIFMLRLINSQIKDGTYSQLFYSQAVVRLCLGSFAGFSTALIFSPDSLSALKGLTASGIAFAAGYSVDIVFAFLDKIVAAFSSKER